MKFLPLVPFAFAALSALAVFPSRAEAADAKFLAYVGTYTDKGSKGIYAYRLDAATGALTPLGLAAESASPSFLALAPDNRFLYAVNESAAKLSAFSVDAQSGRLTLLNQQKSGGDGPCHLSVDHTGKVVVAANYNGGSAEAVAILDDGKLGAPTAFFQHKGTGVNKERQEAAHAHCATIDAANRFVFVCDLGLDKVFVYKLDAAAGRLTPNEPPFATVKPGSGPRHIAFHPNGKFAYVINEMGSSVVAFHYDAERGALDELQSVSTLPANFTGESTCAEVAVHPSGKFLYGSNRGHDSIAVFSIDESTGKLTPVEHVSTQGKTPRDFAIDPTGAFLFAANQDTDSIVTFRIDQKTGRLTPTGQSVSVSMPVCLVFVPVK